MRKTKSSNLKGIRDRDKKTLSGVVLHVFSSSAKTRDGAEEFAVDFMLFDDPEEAKAWLSSNPLPKYSGRSKSMRNCGNRLELPKLSDARKGSHESAPKEPVCVFLRGKMNYKSVYFFQKFRCLGAWDPIRGQSYFRIEEILLQRALWKYPVFTVCESIFFYENGRTGSEFEEFLKTGFGTTLAKSEDPKTKNKVVFSDKREGSNGAISSASFAKSSILVDWFFDEWLPSSEFAIWAAETELREYVPAGIEILTPGNPIAVLEEEEKLKRMLSSDPDSTWILTKKSSIAAEFSHVRFSPVTLDKLEGKMNPVHRRALERYARLKEVHLGKRKETSFSFDLNAMDSKTDHREDLESFAFLTETAKFLVPEILNGRPVYTFDRHFDVQARILRFMDDLCRRDAVAKCLPTEAEDYVPDDRLTTSQLEIVEAVKNLPFVIAMGLPGRGKSRVISEICRRYVSVKSVTGVAALAAETRKKIPHCETIAMAQKAPKRGTQILIIDEFEDNDDRTALRAFTKICPDLVRLVLVFDPMQIAPIAPGCRMAIEFAKAFAETPHVFVLKDQFRFSSDEVARNDEMLLKGKFSKIVHGPKRHLEFVSKSLVVDSLVKLKTVLTETAADFCAEEKGDFQYIALTNAYKDAINEHVEGLKNPRKFAFYSGQRIAISDGNYKKKTLVPWTATSSKNLQSESAAAIKKIKTARETYFSDACNNGETYVVDRFADFDAEDLKWIESSKRTSLTLFEATRYDYLKRRRCLFTRCGKILCIHPEYVPFANVHPGWAITVNKAKGLEYDRVAFAFDAKADPPRFGIHHVHVALTRGKKETKVLNTPEALFFLSKRMEPKKAGTVRNKLKEWYVNFTEEKNRGDFDVKEDDEKEMHVSMGLDKKIDGKNVDRSLKRKRVE
jgi:hypothetical protein